MKTILIIALLGLVPAVAGCQQVDGDRQRNGEMTVRPGYWAVAEVIDIDWASGIGATMVAGGAEGSGRALVSPELARRLQAEARAKGRSRSHWRTGATAGVLIGGGATYHVLHTGGSTATCDRAANQDAIGARECAAAVAGGALVGGALGALIGSRFRKAP